MTDNQDDLFIKANDWMISMFKDASSVIQFNDKQEGVLIGKYLMSGTLNTSTHVMGMFQPTQEFMLKLISV